MAVQEVENKSFNTFYCEQTFPMAPKPLDILKNGLDNFSKRIKTRKEALTLKLSQRESIQETNRMDIEALLNPEGDILELSRIAAWSDFPAPCHMTLVSNQNIIINIDRAPSPNQN